MDFSPLNNLLAQFVADGLPNCSCVVAQKGTILYEGYFGYADIENGVPLTDKHIYRQASLTKVALYTLAMMLYEQGYFTMNEPLGKYFPEWKQSRKLCIRQSGEVEIVPTDGPVTIRHILNMTCGLPYQSMLPHVVSNHPVADAMSRALEPLKDKGRYSLREQIHALADVPLAFEPGARWLYGFASELTAGLIEVLCDMPAEEALRQHLYIPLGMRSTSNYFLDDMPRRLVKNYCLRTGKRLGEADALYFLDQQQDGAFVGPLGTVDGFSRTMSNCMDYTHLMQMLANGGVWEGQSILGRKTIDLMRTNTLSDTMLKEDFHTPYLAGYGYGYGVRTLMNQNTGQHGGSLGSFGWTGGSGTWAEADPATGLSIVYMHNIQPNLEDYHHLRMRTVAYGCCAAGREP